MSKVTSKLQVTIPKRVAEAFGIAPGSRVEFEPAGDVIRLRPVGRVAGAADLTVEERLRLFDEATERQRQRSAPPGEAGPGTPGRGWTRDDLYADRVDRAVRR